MMEAFLTYFAAPLLVCGTVVLLGVAAIRDLNEVAARHQRPTQVSEDQRRRRVAIDLGVGNYANWDPEIANELRRPILSDPELADR